ncbi:MAG TPA: efflux RND transporter periplasmic adaptor subunit [Candidatus Brocadiia bacterium]|nr:efflux RND transporter periplasmic adaptor subunit [Candidatus Brocadiia bacterium]
MRKAMLVAAFFALATAFAAPGAEAPKGTGVSDKVWDAVSMPVEKSTLSCQIDGVAEEVFVEEGDRVTKGHKLVRMDDRALILAEKLADLAARDDSSIRGMEIQCQMYEAERKRSEAMGEAVSPADLLKAQTEAGLSKVQLEASKLEQERKKIEHDLRKVQLTYALLTSPFDGVISRVLIRPGEAVRDMQPVVEVVRVDEIKVMVNVTEDFCGGVCEGRAAQVQFPSLGEKWFEGRVDRVFPVVEQRSGTFQVKILVNNPIVDEATGSRAIKPGLRAKVRFPAAEAKDSQALISRQNGEAKKAKDGSEL